MCPAEVEYEGCPLVLEDQPQIQPTTTFHEGSNAS